MIAPPDLALAASPKIGRAYLRRPLIAALLLVAYCIGDAMLVSRLGTSDATPPVWALACHVLGLVPFIVAVASLATPSIRRQTPPLRWAMWAGLTIACAVSLVALAGTERPTLPIVWQNKTDLALYYAVAYVVRDYGWPHLYDAAAYVHVFHQLGIPLLDPHVPGYTLAPPPLAMLMLPLTYLPMPLAMLAWESLLLGSLAASCRVLWWGDYQYILVQLALLALMPAMAFGIVLGQVMVLVFAAIAFSWWTASRGHDVLAGILLLPLVLKPQLAFMVPLTVLVVGRWRVTLAFGLAAAALAGLSVLLITPPSLAGFIADLRAGATHPQGWSVPPLTLDTFLPTSAAIAARVLAIIATILVAARYRSLEMAFVIGLLASLVVTPYIHIQDLSMLLLAGWILLRTRGLDIPYSPLLLSWFATACASVLFPPLALITEIGWFIWLSLPSISGLRPVRAAS